MLVVAFIIPCAFVLAACGGGLKTGVEYVASVTVQWASEEEKETILAGMEMTEEEFNTQINERFGGVTCVFNKDGTAVSAMEDEEITMYYTVADGKVSIWADEAKEGDPEVVYTLDGSNLVI